MCQMENCFFFSLLVWFCFQGPGVLLIFWHKLKMQPIIFLSLCLCEPLLRSDRMRLHFIFKQKSCPPFVTTTFITLGGLEDVARGQ